MQLSKKNKGQKMASEKVDDSKRRCDTNRRRLRRRRSDKAKTVEELNDEQNKMKVVPKRPIAWRIADSSYVAALRKLRSPNQKWVIVELRMPIWAVGETVVLNRSGVENFYSISGASTKSFLLDPSKGLCDTWANIISIRLGTVRIPQGTVPIIGQFFIDVYKSLARTTLHNKVLKIAINRLTMYLDSKRNTTLVHSENNVIDNHKPQQQPQYPAASAAGSGVTYDGDTAAVGYTPNITERFPVYCMNWQPATPSDQKTWDHIQEGFEKFQEKIINSFRAAGYSRSSINIRNFGKRSISVRRFSDYPCEAVSDRFNDFNYTGENVEGLFGATIELIDKSQKHEMARFCDGMISGRVPIISELYQRCIVNWSTDPSLFVTVDARNVEQKEN